MDKFASLPDSEQQKYFDETAEQRSLRNIIIEKDFWVCWTLKRLFTHSDLAPFLTFKGGTSLSKAYSLIERFSEDIDLTISRTAPILQDVPNVMEDDISGKERKRRLESLKQAAQQYIKDDVFFALQAAIKDELGQSEKWALILDQEDPDLQTILFYYPKVFDYGGFSDAFSDAFVKSGYIRPHIKLEFGARGDIEPNEIRPIRSYSAETLPSLFENPSCDVSVLLAERTFWEKATILHAQHHGLKMRDRMSRHYYDTYVLIESGVADKALQSPELLNSVVLNKSLLFRDPKASYDTAALGSLKLIPSQSYQDILEEDYKKMAQMFLDEIPEFEVIMKTLAAFEEKMNS